jgi:hypothetical protein
MTHDVDWPNGWRAAVTPSATTGNASGPRSTRPPSRSQSTRSRRRIEVAVYLLVRDKTGNVLVEEEVHHVYDFRGDLLQRMATEE